MKTESLSWRLWSWHVEALKYAMNSHVTLIYVSSVTLSSGGISIAGTLHAVNVIHCNMIIIYLMMSHPYIIIIDASH